MGTVLSSVRNLRQDSSNMLQSYLDLRNFVPLSANERRQVSILCKVVFNDLCAMVGGPLNSRPFVEPLPHCLQKILTSPVLSNVRPLLTYLQLGNHDSERLTVIYFDFEQFKELEEFQRWALIVTLKDARPTAAGPDEISAELFEKYAPNAPTADKDGIDWAALGFKGLFCS